MDETFLRENLVTDLISELRYFDSIGSTNDYALSWADSGAPDFSLVIAEQQTKGRGRFDRRWVSTPGSSLTFSVILKPTVAEQEKLALFAPLAGVAVRETFEALLNMKAQIKWPNDILINRRKCAGILVEAAWTGSQVNGVVIGIGINIGHGSTPPATDQLFAATTLEDETHREVDRFSVLVGILQSIKSWRSQFGTDHFFREWQAHLAFIGEDVRIEHSEKPSIIGVVQGIDRNGRLVLRIEDNEEIHLEVGDVHLRPTIKDSNGGNNA